MQKMIRYKQAARKHYLIIVVPASRINGSENNQRGCPQLRLEDTPLLVSLPVMKAGVKYDQAVTGSSVTSASAISVPMFLENLEGSSIFPPSDITATSYRRSA